MKAQNFVLRTVYCLAGLLFLASIGYNVFQHQQFKLFSEKPFSEKITKNEPVSDSNIGSKSTPEGKSGKSNTSKNNELEYHLNSAKEELDMTNEQLAEEQSKKEEFKKSYYQSSRNNNDPVYKKNRRNSITKNINENYTSLFKKLNISEEEFEKLKDILIDKDIEIDDLSNSYNNASTVDEKDKVVQQMNDIGDNYKGKIAEFLGRDKNEIYQSYENMLMERRSLSDFMKGQSPDNLLNEEKMESLIDSMYEARKSFYDKMGNSPKMESASDLTEEFITQLTEKTARLNERYAEVSRGTMTPEQTEQYKTYLKQKLEMVEAALKMSLYLNDNK